MLRRRLPACVVSFVTAAYLVSSIGCSTGVLRQAIAPSDTATANAITLPSTAATAAYSHRASNAQRLPSARDEPIALAQYHAPISTAVNYDDVDLNMDGVVRGQDYPNGPLKEMFTNPYVIGAAIIAGIVIPLAVENRDTPVGGGGGGGMMMGP